MAFLTSRDNDTPESLGELLRETNEALDAGEIDEAEYQSRITQIEARQAVLAVAPVQDANTDARLKDLEYLHEKKWISDEEYEQQKREILGER